MKTLVIIAHPKYDNSMTQGFLKSCQKDIDSVDWLVLNREYPSYNFDVIKEQERLSKYERIVFQFPLYWYSAPAILKQYEDDVLTRSFTYKTEDGVLNGKELGIVTTLGEPIYHYHDGHNEAFTIDELMKPYHALAHKAGMKFLPIFSISQFNYLTEYEKVSLLVKYRNYLTNSHLNSFKSKQLWYIEQLQLIRQNLKDSKKNSMDMLIDQLQNNYDKLDELNWELSMIKKEEDE
ncbi:NAD(P)H-dependent oxidoreductase [Apilactobacillus xinyiensis]|uniref:NAD(P)H-dependent oxidoreductase n=1 Tax=Apilactobacillus xinyiensis TaxID=2841032 RepID=UPI001C7DFBB3|nr:NAD(P)H-dependent oxidoreductase [Apilactobacillus xinyiensis]